MEALVNALLTSVDERYQFALLDYLASPGEEALHDAYELGRKALADGLGVLDLVLLHSRALTFALSVPQTQSHRERALEAQTAFFAEVLSPFEMGHRAFRDANTMLRRLNGMLEAQAKRIAYSLHSEAGQLLASVHLTLAEATRDLPADKAIHLTKVRALLVEI